MPSTPIETTKTARFPRARVVGIFAVKDGLPIGGRLEAMQIMRLMRETRRAT